MYQLILIIHSLIAIILVVLVLIQCGKGAGIGASLGAGASNTVFGSQGTNSFLFKLTSVLALTFFATSLALSFFVSAQYHRMHVGPEAQDTHTTRSPINAIPIPGAKK
ncbi:MAG: preprotein translocase subunit SecG [Legionellales bacterium RIFCSPHIGHO2_12_FULL_42_9]|nr:MAG: preprotein translocase subunit SecG [Legionellales bacterium RIFCSPHIGHO2_12_FULL_42_9]